MLNGKPEIYLAGPEVFLPDPLARATELKAICARLGAVGWFPLDNQDGVADPDPDVMAANISRADEALVRSCDAVVANMTPFRGPSMDAGTIFEMGLAKGLGKLVVGWTTDWRRYGEKVAAAATLVPDGAWLRDEAGMLCRDFGLIDNLMMVKGADAVLGSFEEAVAHVVRHFAAR
ncbi:nucleoside 2-deoxyribosyltransferase [Limobrevibacterium gyesilva]|uniref:Nucleoside 2-deoxyribosyltransferase n=1 Tax=Limobrevibacterium gyesilva TaxID=2991712 RepID=A0AA42CJK4_9PROT|nr:nucleoside 2-deoxyribosyltransferase [Limobrevibacterium gyesilva]MCW3476960.1 nucleoside 2-deoxyribosyltransferase [Limobrevibacterium gyesilva]